jgi:hypothetical protein
MLGSGAPPHIGDPAHSHPPTHARHPQQPPPAAARSPAAPLDHAAGLTTGTARCPPKTGRAATSHIADRRPDGRGRRRRPTWERSANNVSGGAGRWVWPGTGRRGAAPDGEPDAQAVAAKYRPRHGAVRGLGCLVGQRTETPAAADRGQQGRGVPGGVGAAEERLEIRGLRPGAAEQVQADCDQRAADRQAEADP